MPIAPSMRVFRHRAYLQFWIMRQLLAGARQMEAVAIGWQVYDVARLTRGVEESAFMLGLIGLAQFAPVFLLSLAGGQAADRFNHKLILLAANALRLSATLALFSSVFLPRQQALPMIFGVAVVLGCVNAFVPAASNALYPRLVPRAEIPSAIAWNSLGLQAASITGPAIGGLLYIWGPEAVYAVCAVMIALAMLSIGLAATPPHVPNKEARGMAMVREGLRFVRDNKIVLGAISLDLVVVFFAGATALLPVFARDILHVGAEGLGILRAGPAVGAGIVAFGLAVRPLTNRVGRWMTGAIVIYGAAMLTFGLSRSFLLSLAALAVSGAADMISVYVRQSLIQLATPDGMRGRVSSVSFIFISASNELGEFESGVAARFLGPVTAVVLGGIVAITTAIAWLRLFPQLARADRPDDLPEVVLAASEATKSSGPT